MELGPDCLCYDDASQLFGVHENVRAARDILPSCGTTFACPDQ